METRLFPVIFKRVFFGLLLILTVQLVAKERENEPVSIPNPYEPEWRPCISPLIELLGKGWLYLNVDYRRNENFAISLGIAGIEEGWAPNFMGYYFGGKRKRLEKGGGTSVNFKEGEMYNLFVHGVIGYRYQKKKVSFSEQDLLPCL
jgi:hypothetical protein